MRSLLLIAVTEFLAKDGEEKGCNQRRVSSAMFMPKMYFLLTFLALMCFCESSVFNYEKCSEAWVNKGCKLGYHQNLTVLQDDRPPNSGYRINWDDVKGYEHGLLCRCRKKAKARSFKWFAIYKPGICLGSSGDLGAYTRLNGGLSSDAICNKAEISIVGQAPDGSKCVPGQFRAYYYEIRAETGVITEKPTEVIITEEPIITVPTTQPRCKDVADIFVLLDSSGSLKEEGFEIERKFLLEFLKRLDLSSSRLRVGIIQYDEDIQSTLTWKESGQMNLEDHLNWVKNLKYTGGHTLTGKALKTAKASIVVADRREDVHITGIVLTDGVSYDDVFAPSETLRDVYKVKMLAIGVGDYDEGQLEGIVGDKHKDRIILRENITAFGRDLSAVIKDLISKTCTFKGI